MKTYRVLTIDGKVKEFATLPAACRWQDKHGGELQFKYPDGWKTPN